MTNGSAEISLVKTNIDVEKINYEWIQPDFVGGEYWGHGATLFRQKIELNISKIPGKTLNEEIVSSLELIESNAGAVVIRVPVTAVIKNNSGIKETDCEIPLKELKKYELNVERRSFYPYFYCPNILVNFETRDGKVKIYGALYESYKETGRKEVSGFWTWLTGKRGYVAAHNILGLNANIIGSMEDVESYKKQISEGLSKIGYL